MKMIITAKSVLMAQKVLPCDGQGDTDACLTVEVPVGCGRQQRNSGHHYAHGPQHKAAQPCCVPLKVKATEGESHHQETIDSDQADDGR